MAIQPQTELRLLKLPLSIDNKNQLTFSNLSAQTSYFLGLSHLEINNISYQRKDSIIRYPAHIDSIIEYNYCMYQNENYSNKWFYAFITGMRYVNDGMTEIKIETDVFQTWQFDITFKQTFVEREMIAVASDTPGANLEPEGFELGEIKVNATAEIDDLEPVYVIAYSGDTILNSDGTTYDTVGQTGYSYNGVFSSVTFILTNEYGFNVIMAILNEQDNSNHVVTVFSVPKLAVKSKLPNDPPRNSYLLC